MAKRGRPKGSKNKKKSNKQRRRDEATVADEAFGDAFRNIIPAAIDNNRLEEDGDISEETDRFGTDFLPVGYEEEEIGEEEGSNDGEAEKVQNDYDETVGFGSADMYDVEELIELSKMDLKSGEKESEEGCTTNDIIKDLRVGCVSNNSKKLYESANVLFLFYNLKYNKHLIHKTWMKTISSFTYGVTDEAKKNKIIKKTIRKLLQKADEKCPPMDFKMYTAKDFMIYLLSLRSKKKTRLSPASYNGKRSSYFHLCRMYGVKQSDEFMQQITVLFKVLKRRIRKEKQDGEGKSRTGKIALPISFNHCFNYYMLYDNTLESVFIRAFLTITWNLICHATNT